MYLDVNGIKLYYEEYGSGEPLIMLHGNGEDHTIFSHVVDSLSKTHRVILIDSRNHGKSTKNLDLTYSLMSLDIIEAIKVLGLNKPIIYGFSDGGIIALMIAIKCPSLLKKIIISGANINPKGLSRALLIEGKIIYFFTRSKLWHLMLNEPNISVDELDKIKIPVNIIVGQKDCIRYNHTMLIHKSIKNSTLEVVKGATHSSYIIKNSGLFDILNKYL